MDPLRRLAMVTVGVVALAGCSEGVVRSSDSSVVTDPTAVSTSDGAVGNTIRASGDGLIECSGDLEEGRCLAGRLDELELQLADLEERYSGWFYEGGEPLPGMEELAPQHRDAAEGAKGTWAEYREQQCRAVALSYDVGSGAGLGLLRCEIHLTQARVAFLEEQFGDEGD
jgi:hypothetical protein